MRALQKPARYAYQVLLRRQFGFDDSDEFTWDASCRLFTYSSGKFPSLRSLLLGVSVSACACVQQEDAKKRKQTEALEKKKRLAAIKSEFPLFCGGHC